MLKVSVFDQSAPLNVLCLGAHCDDIEIGCGASILKLAASNPSLNIVWIVFSSNKTRAAEATESFERFAGGAKSSEIQILDFRNGYFPYHGEKIKDCFEDLKGRVDPDVIFTHYGSDYHQDHRLISELTWNTFRDHWILEYEIPKFDGGLGSPNLFISTDDIHVQQKSEILLDCFKSQQKRKWFSQSTFEGLMRIRGIECNSTSGYAEAFYARKTIVL